MKAHDKVPASDTSESTGRIIGLWLSLFPLVDFALRPRQSGLSTLQFDFVRHPSPALATALFLLLLGSAIPLIVGILRFGVDLRRIGTYAAVCALLALFMIASAFSGGSAALQAVILASYGLTLSIVFASLNADQSLMRGLFAGLVLGHVVVLLAVIADGNYSWGRLFGRNSPNYWGMAALTLLCGVFALRSKLMIAIAVTVAAAIFVLCQARGSMAAGLVGCVVVGLLWLGRDFRRRAVYPLLGGLAALPFLILGTDFIADRLFQLSTPGRGLDSGFTGRSDAWVEALHLFKQHPWFGVGFRQSEVLITSASSAHNAYLATLAETGIFGFMAYLTFIFGGMALALVKAWREPSGPRYAVVAMIASYAFIGLLERRALNVGNAHSLTLMFCVAWAYRIDRLPAAIGWRERPVAPRRPSGPTDDRLARPS